MFRLGDFRSVFVSFRSWPDLVGFRLILLFQDNCGENWPHLIKSDISIIFSHIWLRFSSSEPTRWLRFWCRLHVLIFIPNFSKKFSRSARELPFCTHIFFNSRHFSFAPFIYHRSQFLVPPEKNPKGVLASNDARKWWIRPQGREISSVFSS